VARLSGRGARAAVLHLRYIERDGVEKDGSKGVLYDATGRGSAEAFEQPRVGEKHQFRVIVSPEDAAELDLTLYVRRLMAQVEQDLGRTVEWAAVNHYNTAHPHAHLVIRGVDRDLAVRARDSARQTERRRPARGQWRGNGFVTLSVTY
jgi:type IV secretory pathway VirD2 relaxase